MPPITRSIQKRASLIQNFLKDSMMSSEHYDSTQIPFFSKDSESKDYEMDYQSIEEIPTSLNQSIQMMYRIIGNPTIEVYKGDWTIMSLNKAMKVYKESSINERHRHRYEFNNKFREEFNENGMLISGTSPDNKLVEITEIFDHPFMIGSQFHPEFKSRPERPHPLFSSFIENSKEIKREGDQHDLF